jgi:outer membrane biosynthesis protein TonB
MARKKQIEEKPEEKPVEVKPEEKPVEVKPVEVKTEVKPVEVKPKTTSKKKPEASNKEHFEAGIQGKKAKLLKEVEPKIAREVSKAEAKTAGSKNEVKDQTLVETAVGGLIGTNTDAGRTGAQFYRI